MNVLHDVDYEAWEQVQSRLNSEVETDLRANREFQDKYDGTVAEVSNKVNDTYLKANGQSDGVKGYDRMVNMIVHDEKYINKIMNILEVYYWFC